jgi:hypothetical protein
MSAMQSDGAFEVFKGVAHIHVILSAKSADLKYPGRRPGGQKSGAGRVQGTGVAHPASAPG